MKTAICDSRMPKAALSALENYCDSILLLPPFSALAEPVSGHPDMLIFPCNEERRLFTHGGYLPLAEKVLSQTGYEIITIPERVSEKYPHDVLLNAALIGDRLLGRLSCVSSSVVLYAKEKGLITVDTRQGYAKCSVCTVSDRAIITSDPSVARTAGENGIEVLEISGGNVDLDGYNCGFIGGASGYDGENVYFCGNVEAHPDGEKIVDFCLRHGKMAISLSKEKLYDVGTVFFI